MAQRLDMINTAVEWRILQKGSRVFALVGKATANGSSGFSGRDIGRHWAITAEYGCLRLERLVGDEEVTGLEVFLPTQFSYEYGVVGISGAPELTRAIFGLLPSELEELVNSLRRGSFPLLGYSPNDLKCSISSAIIPAGWPHVVVSNLPLYGNVVSLESFVRIVVSSLPHGQLSLRFPGLQYAVREMTQLTVFDRRGVPYFTDMIEVPAGALAV